MGLGSNEAKIVKAWAMFGSVIVLKIIFLKLYYVLYIYIYIYIYIFQNPLNPSICSCLEAQLTVVKMEGSLQVPAFNLLPSSLDFASVESRNVPAVISCIFFSLNP